MDIFVTQSLAKQNNTVIFAGGIAFNAILAPALMRGVIASSLIVTRLGEP
jgi:hypothetical protein